MFSCNLDSFRWIRSRWSIQPMRESQNRNRSKARPRKTGEHAPAAKNSPAGVSFNETLRRFVVTCVSPPPAHSKGPCGTDQLSFASPCFETTPPRRKCQSGRTRSQVNGDCSQVNGSWVLNPTAGPIELGIYLCPKSDRKLSHCGDCGRFRAINRDSPAKNTL